MDTLSAHRLAVELASATNGLSVMNMGWRVRIDTDRDVVHVQWIDLIRDAVVKTITASSDHIVAEVTHFVETRTSTMRAWVIEYTTDGDSGAAVTLTSPEPKVGDVVLSTESDAQWKVLYFVDDTHVTLMRTPSIDDFAHLSEENLRHLRRSLEDVMEARYGTGWHIVRLDATYVDLFRRARIKTDATVGAW